MTAPTGRNKRCEVCHTDVGPHDVALHLEPRLQDIVSILMVLTSAVAGKDMQSLLSEFSKRNHPPGGVQ